MNEPKAGLTPRSVKIPLEQCLGVEEKAVQTPSRESDIGNAKSAILAKLMLTVGKDPAAATDRDWFIAVALMARDRVVHR